MAACHSNGIGSIDGHDIMNWSVLTEFAKRCADKVTRIMANTLNFTFHHGGVSVPSLEAAIEWYGRALGFEVEKRFRIEPAKANAAMIRKGPLRMELFQVEGAAPLPEDRRMPIPDLKTHGNKHVAFRVDDLDDFLVEMEGRGVDIAFVVREAFGSGCFIRDCAGNLIEFVTESAL
jgi:catechol 2,3-dioxygenase-like lactoylglutathione lyase family enzyme